MALSPIASSSRATKVAKVVAPSKTYALDLETGDIGAVVDGAEAVRQFIRKAIATARFRFMAYGPEYGCELDELIGQDIPLSLLQAEIPRVIREALIYDGRINDVDGFVITRDSDKLYVSFNAYTTEGVINEGVTL